MGFLLKYFFDMLFILSAPSLFFSMIEAMFHWWRKVAIRNISVGVIWIRYVLQNTNTREVLLQNEEKIICETLNAKSFLFF